MFCMLSLSSLIVHICIHRMVWRVYDAAKQFFLWPQQPDDNDRTSKQKIRTQARVMLLLEYVAAAKMRLVTANDGSNDVV